MLIYNLSFDGASMDNSVGIIKKYENQISYWISEKDKGQSDALNKGFEKAGASDFNSASENHQPLTTHKTP